jgi:hypothetical protein
MFKLNFDHEKKVNGAGGAVHRGDLGKVSKKTRHLAGLKLKTH